MNRMYRGRNFQLVTISLDDLAKKEDALKMLKENHVAAANYILNSDDRDKFAEALDQAVARPGALHARDRTRRQGPLPQDRRDRPARMKRAIVGYLGRTY